MHTITIEGLDDESMKALDEAARQRNVSVNQVVLDAIRGTLGVGKSDQVRHHDLDEFFGSMSKEEAERINRYVAEMRQTDLELQQ